MQLQGKKILVTGADGFIGSHLTEMLLDQGFDVRAFVLYNSFNSFGWLDTLPKDKRSRMEVVSGDIRDPLFVQNALDGCDVIFHLAALIAIPYSYHAPDSYVATNIQGTLNVLNAAKRSHAKRVLTVSTSEVYGTAQYVPIDEKHPLVAQSPYSATKMAADAMAVSFFNSFDLPVTIARPFNTYGPRQSARAFIPTIISQIAAGASEIKIGDLRPIRDLNFVLDSCKGLIGLASCDAALGQVVNIGSNTAYSVGEVLEKIKVKMNSSAAVVTDTDRLRPLKSEVFKLQCDNTRIKELIGYTPDYDIDRGLDITISWFLKPINMERYKTETYNV